MQASSSNNLVKKSQPMLPQHQQNDAAPHQETVNADNANDELSAYEQYRAQIIERNQRKLSDLGLVSVKEAKKVIDSAWKKTPAGAAVDGNSKKRNRNDNDNMVGTKARQGKWAKPGKQVKGTWV